MKEYRKEVGRRPHTRRKPDDLRGSELYEHDVRVLREMTLNEIANQRHLQDLWEAYPNGPPS